MSPRDRLLLGVVGIVAILGGFWMLVLGPARADLGTVEAELAGARATLAGLNTQAASAQEARSAYVADRRAVARMERALPADDATSELLLELDRAAGRSSVKLTAISPTAATPGVAPAAATGTPALPAGVTEMTLQLSFAGTFPDLRRFLERIHGTTSIRGEAVRVAGRLIDVRGLKLDADGTKAGRVKASVTAAVYTAAPPTAAPAAPGAPAVAPVAAPAPTAPAAAPTAPPAPTAPSGVAR